MTKVEIIQSQKLVCLRRSKFLVTLLLQQLGRIPRLLRCTMGTSSVVQLLCRPKGLQGKGHHGIQPCRRADQRLFQFRAHFLVKHFMHPQVQYIPLQQCRQVLHLSKQAQLLPPVWLLGEYLSQVVRPTCDLGVVLHLQELDLLVPHHPTMANKMPFLFFSLNECWLLPVSYFCFFFGMDVKRY